jgi:mono/diheme cytochrome c family protein
MRLHHFLPAFVGLTLFVEPTSAQLLTIDRPGQYNQADIARGGLVYTAQCVQCHGRDGDQISGVDLRRGLFRRSQSDEDLAQTITRGTPGGMPAFKLEPADLTGTVAFIRAGFDASASISLAMPHGAGPSSKARVSAAPATG